ncbi:MAG: ATP-grasp domain-containing protein, partial [Candidatus Thiodiazotropha sp.]
GRAMAESALRGGYAVTVLDGFCDQDTLAVADCWPLSQAFSELDTDAFIEEMASLFPEGPGGVVYGAGLEGAPWLLERLSEHYPLYGNAPGLLEILRYPRRFFSLLNRLRIPYPEVLFNPPYSAAPRTWLIKRAGSCGGQGVAWFDREHAVSDAACYYQRYLEGSVMSALFIADGRRHRTIGYNRLGFRTSNAPAPFLYAGAVGQASLPGIPRRRVERMVEKLVGKLRLRGINSIDFIVNRDGVFLLDLNARPTATLELYEHLTSDGWMRHHVRACLGTLPVLPLLGSAVAHGHLIVYAPHLIDVPLSMAWPDWVKDRPSAGARIAEGQPLCSVFADGADAQVVEDRLLQRQAEILRLLSAPEHRPEQRRMAV